jgi:galactokinase/mevalonate kinase-like predicted kinase
MRQSEIKQFTSWLGKRSYKARVARFGLERIQEIARENGKRGGRPKGSGNEQPKKGGKADGPLQAR